MVNRFGHPIRLHSLCARLPQLTAGLVPHACGQPYHAGSGSHRQLFRPYWGPLAWQSRWDNERG